MKRNVLVGALVTLSVAVAAFVTVPMAYAADTTITGVVLDSKCTTKLNKPADPCHLTGAQAGDVMVIRGKDVKSYQVVGSFAASSNAKLLPFVGKNVTVSGSVTVAGMKRTIDITTIALAK